MRNLLLGLAALLAAGAVGLFSADAQSKRKSLPVTDLRRVAKFEKEAMDSINRMIAQLDPSSKAAFIRTSKRKTSSDESSVRSESSIFFPGGSTTASLQEVQAMRGKLAARLKSMKEKGELNDIDRRILRAKTFDDLKRLVGR